MSPCWPWLPDWPAKKRERLARELQFESRCGAFPSCRNGPARRSPLASANYYRYSTSIFQWF